MERPEPQLGTQDETLLERTAAWVVDGIIILLLFFVIARLNRGFGTNVMLAFGANLAYKIAFEATYGQTIGKKLLDIVVVQEDGSDCTWTASVFRNVLRLIDGLPAFYLIGLVAIFASNDRQRIGDRVANTVVVEVASEPKPEPEPEPEPDRRPSRLLVDEVRRRGNDTYLVLRNVADEAVDLSDAEIDDAHGNRHPFPGSVTIAPDATETFRFGASTEFDPDPGTPLVLFTADGVYEIGWGESAG